MSERNGATESDSPRSGGPLGMVLSGVVVLAFFAFLYLVSPYFLYMALAVLALFLLAGLHWVLWGKQMTKETEEERRQLLEQDAREERQRAEKPQQQPWERRF